MSCALFFHFIDFGLLQEPHHLHQMPTESQFGLPANVLVEPLTTQ